MEQDQAIITRTTTIANAATHPERTKFRMEANPDHSLKPRPKPVPVEVETTVKREVVTTLRRYPRRRLIRLERARA